PIPIEFGRSPRSQLNRRQRIEAGHLAQHLDLTVSFDCLSIVRVGFADHDDPRYLKHAAAKGLQSEQRVINGAELRSNHDDNRQLQLRHQIGHRFTLVDRYQDTACPLHDPAIRTGLAFDPLDHRIEVDPCPAARSGQVRRNWQRQGNTRPKYFVLVVGCQPHYFGRVIVLLDAGLNGLPVSKRYNRPVALQERGRDDGLADPSVGSGYEETAEHRVAPSRTPARPAANRSTVASSRLALSETRRRAVPGGTLGGRMARQAKTET